MKLKSPSLFIWLPLVVAWSYDYMFYDKEMGISFTIIVALMVGVGLFLARREHIEPGRWTLALLIPIGFFALMTFIRKEDSILTMNWLTTLLLMVLLAHSFRGGKWPYYQLGQYLNSLFSVIGSSFFRQLVILKNQPDNEERQQKRKLGFAVVRGVLLGLVLVFLLGIKLGMADPVFNVGVQWVLKIKFIQWINEHIWEGIWICFLAYILSGIYFHAFYKDHDEGLALEGDETKNRILGFVESSIILSLVNLLFLTFVVVQFKYFFGGQRNINFSGYTYAEYARQGFGEMVSTAVIMLVLLQVIYICSRREGEVQNRVISALGVTQVVLVGVILVSALSRLLLYEQAYGFTEDRTLTHVFIFWLAGLLVAVVVLEIIRKQRFYMLAMQVAWLGYVATLDVMNVDAFVARQNVARALAELEKNGNVKWGGRLLKDKFDFQYLGKLSEDVLPSLARLYRETPELEDELAAAIACHVYQHDEYTHDNQYSWERYIWSSFHLSDYRAKLIYDELSAFPEHDDFETKLGTIDDWERNYVTIGNQNYDCYSAEPLLGLAKAEQP